MKDMLPNITLPSIDPDQLIDGYTFTAEYAGITQKAKVMEQISDTIYNMEYADGNDDHLTYEEIINMLNRKKKRKEPTYGHLRRLPIIGRTLPMVNK